jgi:hypothetical protein
LSRYALRAAAAIMAAAAAPVWALDAGLDAGLQWHELRERDAAGRTLVREQGWAPRLGVALSQRWADAWTLRGGLSGWSSRATYDGRSQGGVPIGSHTDTRAATLDAALLWQPIASSTAQLEAGWQIEQFRRRIRGAGGYSGLDERLTQPRWSLGASWRSGGEATIRAALLWGDRAPLSVRFDDDLYDTAHLRSGRATGVALDAAWPLTRQWRIAASAEALSISRSLDAPLTRGGAVVGTVSQPSWRRERVAVLLQRSFAD